jgi:hypothetical protein
VIAERARGYSTVLPSGAATVLPCLLALSFLGCRSTLGVPDFTMPTGFPLGVGSEWIYATYDSVAHRAGSTRVSILSDSTLSGGVHQTRWEFRSESRTDTALATSQGDTLRLTLLATTPAPPLLLILPLVTGTGWRSSPADSVAVLLQQSVEVPAGVFSEAYLVHQEPLSPNDLSFYDYAIVPEVGIVYHIRRIRIGNEPQDRGKMVWELASYALH